MNRTRILAVAAFASAAVGHIAHLRRQLAAAVAGATTDPLTGLVNRAGLRRDFEQLVVSAEHHENIAVAMLDLVGFKQVNDTYGHDAGDQILIHVARRMIRQHVNRRPAVAARLGGDEFVLAFHTDPRSVGDAPDDVAGRLADAVRLPISLGTVTIRPRASIGFAHAPATESNLSDLLAEADAAMYRAKRAGLGYCGHIEPVDGPAVRATRPPVRTRDHKPHQAPATDVIQAP